MLGLEQREHTVFDTGPLGHPWTLGPYVTLGPLAPTSSSGQAPVACSPRRTQHEEPGLTSPCPPPLLDLVGPCWTMLDLGTAGYLWFFCIFLRICFCIAYQSRFAIDFY